jgi:tripartite-type tricarboxylate transporter receptor subunit TctC
VPAGTPAAVIERVNADVNAVLRDPDVRAKLDSAGMTPVGGTAAEFAAVVAADTQRWGAIIRRIGLKLE